MKYPVLLAVLLATTALAVPGGRFFPQRRSHDPRIPPYVTPRYGLFHANESDVTKYPYTVSVYSKSYDAIIGSGAILNHYWILVSAYEILGVTADDLIVRAGSNYSDHGGLEYNVSEIVVNQYFGHQYWDDIALLKTQTKIVYSDSVKRINLAYYTPQANTTAITSGFGGNEEEDGVLRSATVTVLSNATCEEYFSANKDNRLCTVSEKSAPAAFDDFGNPLVQNRLLVGMYLGTIESGPDVYINIAYWKGWIVENIKRNH